MPFTPSPSSVFPNHRYSITSESQEAYGWQAPPPTEKPFYRGPAAAKAAPYVQVVPSVAGELASLTARVAAMQATTQEPPAAPPAAAAPTDDDGQVWEGASYGSFAQYAGEASRVKGAGRLPFGSDVMKMKL